MENDTAQTRHTSPIALDLGLCKACGICVRLCPERVYDRDELGYPIVARDEDCTQCLRCELRCPDFAIEIERRPPKKKAAAAAGTAAAADPPNGIIDAEDKEGLT